MDLVTIALLATPLLMAPCDDDRRVASTPASAVAPARLPTPADVGRLAGTPQDGPYTDAYYRRLDIHRYASYAMLPLFALQVAAGTQLFNQGREAPQWAQVGHRVGATGVAAMFATNVLTGVPNLVVGMRDPRNRGRRLLHGTLMLTAAAGFTATGLLAERAEGDPGARSRHRQVAFTSLGVALAGWLTMLDRTDD